MKTYQFDKCLKLSSSSRLIQSKLLNFFCGGPFSTVVKLKKHLSCAIFDKSTKLSRVLAYGMKFIFRRGGIEFSDLGGPCSSFYGPPNIGHNRHTHKL